MGPRMVFEGDKESPEQFQDDPLMAQDGPQDGPNRSPNKKGRQLQLQARWTPKWPRRHFKTFLRGSKKVPTMPPSGPRMGLRRLQKSPNKPQEDVNMVPKTA